MAAIELVSDQKAKTPAAKEVCAKVQTVAFDNGAMIRVSGPNIILSPPLILTSDDVTTILSALDAGLAAA